MRSNAFLFKEIMDAESSEVLEGFGNVGGGVWGR